LLNQCVDNRSVSRQQLLLVQGILVDPFDLLPFGACRSALPFVDAIEIYGDFQISIVVLYALEKSWSSDFDAQFLEEFTAKRRCRRLSGNHLAARKLPMILH